VIKIMDNHMPRLVRMAPALIVPDLSDEVAAAAESIVDDAKFSIIDGAISGPGHIPSLPGEPPSADTHELDESIHVGEVIETTGSVKGSAIADSFKAKFLELGTSNMVERPFMGPATRRNHGKIIRSIADRLRKGRM
jgi:HK97 gp10 family phage protein